MAQFHRNTLDALRELVQAAGLQHPRQISASHIVHRNSGQDVRLLSSLLLTVAPGALLAAERGEVAWPHAVFSLYWPLARSDSFQALAAGAASAAGRFKPPAAVGSRSVEVALPV